MLQSSRRRTTAMIALVATAGLAATGVTVALAETDGPGDRTEVQAIAEARHDQTPDARREAWLTEVGEYVEGDAARRWSLAVYGRLVEWNAAQEYAEALAAAAPSGSGSSHLAAIRQCESSGDYSAVSPSGTYRGAYQFDQQTWESVGGSGDPAAASPAEQDHRAQLLYAQRGAQPWPVCGQ